MPHRGYPSRLSSMFEAGRGAAHSLAARLETPSPIPEVYLYLEPRNCLLTSEPTPVPNVFAHHDNKRIEIVNVVGRMLNKKLEFGVEDF